MQRSVRGVALLLPLVVPVAVVAVLAGGGCAAPATDDPCRLVAWYRPSQARALGVDEAAAAEASLVGSWDGWRARDDWQRLTASDGSEWRRLAVTLPPGRHQYAIAVGGRLLVDEMNPTTSFIAQPLEPGAAPYGTEVSEIDLTSCRRPALTVETMQAEASALRLRARRDDGALIGSGLRASLRRGPESLPSPSLRVDGDGVTLAADGLPAGKYTVTLDGDGMTPVAASVFVEPDAGRLLDDGLVYQIMVDRFRGRGALDAPASPGDRAGGTLDGVRAAVEAGYFARLGVTTLWLSPLYQNPAGRHVGRDGHLYEAYHGYWPSAPRTVEPLLGGEAALDALVAAAHARGLRILFDAVPNHVHQSHPYYSIHSRKNGAGAASWFNDGDGACVCGDPDCDWGAHIEDCWFGSELPDLNWRDPEVVQAGTDDLVWWLSRFDLDGVRIDAVPMMPRAASRRLAHAVRTATQRRGLDALVLGETYTGPGQAGRAEIRAYLGQALDGLDSEFDFPLMWATRDVIAHGTAGFDGLENEIQASAQVWAGSGAVMSHMLGNHDTTRFISEIVGDAGGDPWLAPPAQPTAEMPYRLQLIGLTLLLTLPGLPVLYYGDEVGLAGAGDPDSRRPLPDVLGGALPSLQAQLLDATGRLGRLRRCSAALRRGERRALVADALHDVALHEAPSGEVVVVALSRDANPAALSISGIPAGDYRDVLSDSMITVAVGAPLVLAPLSAAVYLPADSSCLEGQKE